MGIGMQEMLIILLVVLVLFGAKKLPEIGGGLGRAAGRAGAQERRRPGRGPKRAGAGPLHPHDGGPAGGLRGAAVPRRYHFR